MHHVIFFYSLLLSISFPVRKNHKWQRSHEHFMCSLFKKSGQTWTQESFPLGTESRTLDEKPIYLFKIDSIFGCIIAAVFPWHWILMVPFLFMLLLYTTFSLASPTMYLLPRVNALNVMMLAIDFHVNPINRLDWHVIKHLSFFLFMCFCHTTSRSSTCVSFFILKFVFLMEDNIIFL